MLPYVSFPTLGPITSFGICAFLGAHFGSVAANRHAHRLGLDPAAVRRMIAFCAIGGILGAHLIDLFFYQPGWYERDGALWTFLNPFAGISSYGGLLGGTLGFLVFARKRRGMRLRFADVGAIGVVVLLMFGRAGCASVHDHVGVATDFALAVDFPRGSAAGVAGPHHDLGLYEFALFALVLAPLAWLLARKVKTPGVLLGVVALGYAVPRFFLDFLRRELDNPRYAAFTPAQWGCLATIIAAAVVLRKAQRPASSRSPAAVV